MVTRILIRAVSIDPASGAFKTFVNKEKGKTVLYAFRPFFAVARGSIFRSLTNLDID